MKITSTRVREFLILLLVAVSITLAYFEAISYSQAKVADFIYKTDTAPFLEQTLYINHPYKH